MRNLILTAFAVLLSISIQAQQGNVEKKESEAPKSIDFKVKEGPQPDIYVDGKKFDFSPDLIDVDRIESVSVIKGERALKEYNSKNGVILFTTKKFKDQNLVFQDNKQPLILIDGEKSDKKTLSAIDSKDIERIDVFKGKEAQEKYDAPNGAIVVTLKKKH